MTTTSTAFGEADPLRPGEALHLAAPPAERPVEWRRAVRALRELLADPDQTQKAFEVFLALDGGHSEWAFQRLLAQPQGARLAAERPCLLRRLSDRAALAALPAESFGRGYHAYLERTGFEPDGLLKLKAEMEAHAESIGDQLLALDPIREWFRERGLLTHDLWHVLTGYGTDPLGEAALLAFSCAQMPGRANRLLMIGAGLRSAAEVGIGFAGYLYRAWRRGRRAVWLPALPYEELLDQPLEAVRRLARIEPPSVAHPGGILHSPNY